MKIGPEHVGQTIYGLPKGNNAERGELVQKPEPFQVIKVARRYAVLESENGSISDYDRRTGADKSSIRAGFSGDGYDWFESLDAVNDHNKALELGREVYSFFRYGSSGILNLEELEVIDAAIKRGKARKEAQEE